MNRPDSSLQGSHLAIRSNLDPDHRVVAVSGAHSFLGTEVIRRLEQDRRYRKILAIDIRKPRISLKKTKFFKVDLTLPNADGELAHIFAKHKVDTLVHLAFLSKPSHNGAYAHELEAIGTMQLLNACAASKVHKVVHWSLTSLYGALPRNPNFIKEDAKLQGIPESRFFADKIEAERLARRHRNENRASVVTVLRTAWILGHRVSNYVSRVFANPVVPVMMGYDPLVQFLHEEDALDMFKLAIDLDFNGTYNVASEGVLPLSTALAMAGRVSVPLPHTLAYPVAKLLWMTQALNAPPMYFDFMRYLCVADTSRAENEMGWSPRFNIGQIVREFAGTASRREA